jgi:alkyl hydroperoxide reductase subunit F
MENNYDLIIIGGGPAGMTAGIYAGYQGIKTLLITKNFGGQMSQKTVMIENFPGFAEISGIELIKNFEKHLRKFPVEIFNDAVVKVKKENKNFIVLTGTEKKEFQARAVIIASGADPRPLEVPGEKEFIGRGVSYCVNCDGPLFRNKNVAVVGGGNAGVEAAIALAQWAKKIYILEFLPQLAADQTNIQKVKKIDKVEIITNAEIKEIKGKTFVENLIYQERGSDELKTIEVDGVFIEIGSIPATDFVKDLVEFNEKDEIIVNPYTGETKTPGLFAAGDVDNVLYKQIIIACGEGAKAAISAIKYLRS